VRRRVAAVVVVVAGYAALALLLYRPINPLAAARLPRGGFGDPVQMMWFLEWTAQALVHGHNPFQTTALDYPLGVNLAANTLTPALGVLVAPVTLTLGPVAAFNLLLRLSYVASASSLCFVLRRRGTWWPAAVVGGLLYGFGPYALSQGNANAHLVLLFDPLLPLLFALLEDLLVRRRGEPRVTGLLLGIVAGLQALIDLELLAEAVILAVVAVAVTAAARTMTGRTAALLVGARRVGRAALPLVLSFIVLAGLELYELLFGRRHLNGPVQIPARLDLLRYDLFSAVLPTSTQAVRVQWAARLADRFVGGYVTENGGYLGLVLVAAFLASAWWGRRIAVVRLAALLAGAAWVLSLGRRLNIDGRTTIVLPGAVFGHLPLLASIVAARFGLFTDLFVAVVVAIGLDRLRAHLGSGPGPVRARLAPGPGLVRAQIGSGPGPLGRGRVAPGSLGRGATVGLAGLIVVGLASVLPAGRIPEPPLGWPSRLPAVLDTVVPRDGVVFSYPYPVSPVNSAMGWAAIDRIRFRLVGGYATVPGPPGSASAQTAPDLVAPVLIQELLAFDAGESPYPSPSPSRTPETERRDLLQTLRTDRVDVVVDWPVGRHPAAATQLFVQTLGAPTWRVGDALIWRMAATASGAAARPGAGVAATRPGAGAGAGPGPVTP
jgi:hypothetical protein